MAKSKKATQTVSVNPGMPAMVSVKPGEPCLPILRPLPQPLHDRKMADGGTSEIVFFAGDFTGNLRKHEEFDATGIRIECSADVWFHADVHFGFGTSNDWLTAPMNFFRNRTVSLMSGRCGGKECKPIRLTYSGDDPCKFYVKITTKSRKFIEACPMIIDVYIEGTRYSYI